MAEEISLAVRLQERRAPSGPADADGSRGRSRCPVDREGQKHERAPYIDLAALQKHVDEFVSVIDGYMAHSEQAREFEREMQREFEREMQEMYGEDVW